MSVRSYYIIISVFSLLSACAGEGEVFLQSEAGFAQGNVFFVDINSGDTIRNEGSIMSIIRYDDGRPAFTEGSDSVAGSFFQFGPLDLEERFRIHSKFYDEVTRVMYEGYARLDTLKDGPNEVNIELLPLRTSASIFGEITYIDLVTKEHITEQDRIVNTLRGSNGDVRRVMGSDFLFDSLRVPATYTVTSSYHDSQRNVYYSYDTTFTTTEDQLNGEFTLQLEANKDRSTLVGAVHYINPVSGFEKEATEAEGSITFEDPLKGFGEEVSVTSSGGTFSFGPLKIDRYVRAYSYFDGVYSYYYSDTVDVDGEEPLVYEKIILNWLGETVLSGTVKYVDPLTGIENVASTAIGSISFLKPGKNFENGVVTEWQGADFTLGPLKPDDYVLDISYSDGLFNYLLEDTITIDGTSPAIQQTLYLNPHHQTLLRGLIRYTDPIKGTTYEATNAHAAIEFLDPLKSFSPNVIIESDGAEFMLGPVLPEQYVRNFTFNDGVFNYSLRDTVSISGEEIITYETLDLSWQKTTGLIVRVSDDKGNLLSDTNIYLYKNYDFLLAYKDNPEAATAFGVTGDDGTVVFGDLEPGPTWVYATKVFVGDTLTNDSTSSTPISLIKDIVRTINTQVTIQE